MVCAGESKKLNCCQGRVQLKGRTGLSVTISTVFEFTGVATRTAAGCWCLLSSSRLRSATLAAAAPSMSPVTDQSATPSGARVSGNSASTTSRSPAAAAAAIGLAPLSSAASGSAPACSRQDHRHG